MMGLQKYFSQVFVAKTAQQKHHHDTKIVVNMLLIWMADLTDTRSENVCQVFTHQAIPVTHLRLLVC